MTTWISAQNLIGGMALGFEKEFGPPSAIITNGNYNDQLYINYCKQRGYEIPVILMDSEYSCKCDIPKVDIWVMTPVCSGLSMLNTKTSGELERCNSQNKQNQNMYNLLSLALKHNPKVIVFENAPILYTSYGAKTVEVLQKIADKFGYSFGLFTTNTKLHGIPQNRKRTFALFYRDTNPAILNFENLPLIDFCEFISNIPENATLQEPYKDINEDILVKFILDYTKCNNLKDAYNIFFKNKAYCKLNEIIQKIGFGKFINWLNDKIKNNDVKIYQRYLKNAMHYQNKVNQNKEYFDVSASVFAKGYVNAIISKNLVIYNYLKNRYLTYRELMTLMGLPYDFQLPKKSDILEITRSVPVCTSNFIAKQIQKYLNNELPISRLRFIKQNNMKRKNDLV